MDLEILVLYQRGTVFGLVGLGPDTFQFGSERGLSCRIEPSKRHLRRTEIAPKKLDDISRRSGISKLRYLRRAGQLADVVAEALPDGRLVPPEHRRRNSWRRRHVLSRSLEHLSGEPRGGPIAHGDRAPGAADAQQLGNDHVRTWGKHGAKHGNHAIERSVGIRQAFGVALVKLDSETFFCGANASLLQEIGGNVHSRDRGSGASWGDGGVACAAGHVQQLHSRLDVDSRHELFAEFYVVGGDDPEVSSHPSLAHALLESGEIDCGTHKHLTRSRVGDPNNREQCFQGRWRAIRRRSARETALQRADALAEPCWERAYC